METWKEIKGAPGYMVSDMGRVKSVAGVGQKRGFVLQPWIDHLGIHCVGLSIEGTTKINRVHRLVASAFLGSIPAGKEINHKIPDRSNNMAENLEYITHKENIQHAVINKRFPEKKKTSKMKRLYGYTLHEMAERFGAPFHHYHYLHRKGLLENFFELEGKNR